jgi:DNA polymerase III epsilon subunit-like protein
MRESGPCLPMPETVELNLSWLPEEAILLDVETTGLDVSRGARVWELGCVLVTPEQSAQTLSLCFEVERTTPAPLSPQIIHPFAYYAHDLHSMLSNKLIVAYQVSFDLRMLAAEFERSSLKMPPVVSLDLRVLASTLLHTSCTNLKDTLLRAGADPLEMLPWHRALPDALRLATLLSALSCHSDFLATSWKKLQRPVYWGAAAW